MPRSQRTQATAIAALEARRNEEQTLAAGALQGERRAALARVAMAAMFAIATEVAPRLAGMERPAHLGRQLAGSSYLLYAIALVFILRRVEPHPRKALWRPLAHTAIDFGFATYMGWTETQMGDFRPEMAAASSSVLIAFAIARTSLWHLAAAVALACTSFVAVTWHAGELGARSTPFVIAGFLALGFLIAMTNLAVRRMFGELRRRDNLTRFLPRPVADRVLAGGTAALAPLQREVTVLFSDIRGFTALSETLPPRAVLELLDDYFGRMTQIVKGHDGVVGKFLGDGLLAFWGVPDADPDHARKAVAAAVDMLRALDELNRARADDGLPPLRIGIGIHTGPVAAGMLGGAEHAEYTIIGDAVNVAARVEALTKERGVAVLVSESTWNQGGDRFPGERLAPEAIRGRVAPVVVYALAARPAEIP